MSPEKTAGISRTQPLISPKNWRETSAVIPLRWLVLLIDPAAGEIFLDQSEKGKCRILSLLSQAFKCEKSYFELNVTGSHLLKNSL